MDTIKNIAPTAKVMEILQQISACLPTIETTRIVAINDFPDEPRWHGNLVLLFEIRPELAAFLDNYNDLFAEDTEILGAIEKLTDERLAWVGDCYTNEPNTRGVTHFLLSQDEDDQDTVLAALAQVKKFTDAERTAILHEVANPI